MTTAVLEPVRLPDAVRRRLARDLEVSHVPFEGRQLTEGEIYEHLGAYENFLAELKAAGGNISLVEMTLDRDRVLHTHMADSGYPDEIAALVGCVPAHNLEECLRAQVLPH